MQPTGITHGIPHVCCVGRAAKRCADGPLSGVSYMSCGCMQTGKMLEEVQVHEDAIQDLQVRQLKLLAATG